MLQQSYLNQQTDINAYEVDINVPFNVTIVVPSHSQATMHVIDANVRSRDE